MTGTSIVTQNVTTFIKNSANFENIFCQGFYADIPSNKKKPTFADFFLLLFSSYFFIPQKQETCQDAQQRNDDADRPAQVPHAAGTEDYANKQGSKRHSHISCPAGKPCDDRRSGDCRFLRSALGCLNAWMLDCWDAWLFGCVTAGMPGCLDV